MYDYKATVLRVIDGDTFDVDLDLGFHQHITPFGLRIYGVDTPEHGQAGHDEASAYLATLLPPGTVIVGTTIRPDLKAAGLEKYGRWLAHVATPTCPDVAQAIIDAGHGTPYFGGHKTGGVVDASKLTLVGETGPEIIRLPPGTTITPA